MSEKKIEYDLLSHSLASLSDVDRIALLNERQETRDFFLEHPDLWRMAETLSTHERALFGQLIVIGQAARLFSNGLSATNQLLFQRLSEMDRFYREIGGLVGYQAKVLSLLETAKIEVKSEESHLYHAPVFHDITTPSLQECRWGIEATAELAEIYPLGGAADRLHLVDEKSKEELPAAKLPFAGKMLLEHLIRDVQAKERLYYLETGRQVVTPIALMTSHEKNNHAHVVSIFEQNDWFGRPKDSIRFFVQPLVPAVVESGDWCLLGPAKPLFKPGGHGAIWKLALDSGIFDWFKALGKKKALIRQINNPIAGLDHGLLAFTGIGWKKEMQFGFASCPRLLKAAEGVNVLVQKGDSLVLTNIEYCDFASKGIEDKPLKEGEPYSRFSSNTNILFADLEAVSKAALEMPLPGLLINWKKTRYTTDSGELKEEKIARLESTMQNIADAFVEPKKETLSTEKTYLTYNVRHKTISTAKRAYANGSVLQETPENCFYDLLSAHRELLEGAGFTLPEKRTLEEYLAKGPEFVLLYHPALGPLYSTIREKLQSGRLETGSELILEIAEMKARHVHLKGSLHIIAEEPLGAFDQERTLHYSDQVGRVTLENVTIENEGVDWEQSSPFWRMQPQRKECVQVILKGNSHFIARNIHLKGSHTFVVEEGQTLTL